MSKNKTGASVRVRIEHVSDLIDVSYRDTRNIGGRPDPAISCQTGMIEVFDKELSPGGSVKKLFVWIHPALA